MNSISIKVNDFKVEYKKADYPTDVEIYVDGNLNENSQNTWYLRKLLDETIRIKEESCNSYFLVTHCNDVNIKVITKQKCTNDAIKYVSEVTGYSVLSLSAFKLEDLLKMNENFVNITFE